MCSLSKYLSKQTQTVSLNLFQFFSLNFTTILLLSLLSGVCALLYSYKAYFGSSGHSVVTLVPQMLELQATIQGEREGYKVADNIWDRRQARLAESLVGEGESLAKRFTHGNEEYPLEHFEKTDLGMFEIQKLKI